MPNGVKSCASSSLFYDVNGIQKCTFDLTANTTYQIDNSGEITAVSCNSTALPIEYEFHDSDTYIAICELISEALTYEDGIAVGHVYNTMSTNDEYVYQTSTPNFYLKSTCNGSEYKMPFRSGFLCQGSCDTQFDGNQYYDATTLLLCEVRDHNCSHDLKVNYTVTDGSVYQCKAACGAD